MFMNGTTISNTLLTGPKEQAVGPEKLTFGKNGFHRLVILGIALLALALVAGVVPRLSQRARATADTKQLAIATVSVVSPTTGAPPDGLMLPAEVKPWQEASIFSRVIGYL